MKSNEIFEIRIIVIIILMTLWTSANLHGQWATSGSDIYNTNSGNVGIGVSSPVSLFHLKGVNGNMTFESSPMFDAKVRLVQDGIPYWNYGMKGTDSGRPFRIGSPNISDANTKFTILDSGHVGIGTTNPSKLLSVNGHVIAKEYEATLLGWSDFVFDSNYNLMPLADLKKFIEENNHLPQIPTEAQVLSEGIKLGEMNAKLLAKIEELTLHVIYLNERIAKLETTLEYGH